jgi:lysozyme
MTNAYGCDISHYQEKINWDKVGHTSIDFVFIKASQGIAYRDPMFDQNWKGASEQSILRGAYHFYEPEMDPVSQAQWFYSVSRVGELPFALDVEKEGSTSTGVGKFVDEITKLSGKKPIVYTSASAWPGGSVNAFLWVAHWYVQEPKLPSEWNTWQFWQYSNKGSIPGISTNVDLNVFNGDVFALKEWLNPLPGGCGKLGALWRRKVTKVSNQDLGQTSHLRVYSNQIAQMGRK